MTATTEDVRTEAPSRFNINWPIHHLNRQPLDRLVAALNDHSDATDSERTLMGTVGEDDDARRQRRSGLTPLVRRLLARRRTLRESAQWEGVQEKITSKRFARVLGDLPEAPDDYFFTPRFFTDLADALPIVEAIRRREILAGLAMELSLLAAKASWADAVANVRSPKYRSVLTEGIRTGGGDGYINTVTRALTAVEGAMRNLAKGPAISGTSAVAVPQGPAKRRRAHARARDIRKKSGPQSTKKGAPVEKPAATTTRRNNNRRDRTS